MNKLFNTHPLVVDNFNLYQMDRTLWYTINYDELEKLVEDYYKSKGESLLNLKDKIDGLAHTQNKNKIGKDKDSKLRYSMVK